MDAVRIRDSKRVCLKSMSPSETRQTRDISLQYKADPKNHAVPVLDLLIVGTEGYRIAVLPYLRDLDDPQFVNVGEVVEAVKQFLEGIEFIHSNARSSLPAVKYHFIDFGLSVSVDPSNPSATSVVGQDRTVPEFKEPDAPYNPLKLDIYQLGNAFKTRLIDHYEELDFLSPLTTTMTQTEPEKRPTAAEAGELFASIIQNIDLDAPVTLKPDVNIWGSNPPGQPVKTEQLEKGPKKGIGLKAWLLSLYSRIRNVLSR